MKNNLKSTFSQHFKDQEECKGHGLSENVSNYSDDLIKFFKLLIEADREIKMRNNKKDK